jgi:hypothetical protein
MGDVGLDTDVAKWEQAIDSYEAATGKDHAEVLNHAERNIGFRSAQFTPAATRARIKADLKRDGHMIYALTSKALKARGIVALKTPEFAKAVEKFLAKRVSSARYLRSAFAQGVIDLGGHWRGRRFTRGASGFGNEASPHNLVAELVAITNQPDESHAASAEQIGLDAINKAIEFVADDMQEFADRIMGQTAREHSG